MSNTISRIRLEKKYSQDDISKLTQIPQTTLSGWEKGLIDQTARRLIRLANALEESIENLFPLPTETSRE